MHTWTYKFKTPDGQLYYVISRTYEIARMKLANLFPGKHIPPGTEDLTASSFPIVSHSPRVINV